MFFKMYLINLITISLFFYSRFGNFIYPHSLRRRGSFSYTARRSKQNAPNCLCEKKTFSHSSSSTNTRFLYTRDPVRGRLASAVQPPCGIPAMHTHSNTLLSLTHSLSRESISISRLILFLSFLFLLSHLSHARTGVLTYLRKISLHALGAFKNTHSTHGEIGMREY